MAINRTALVGINGCPVGWMVAATDDKFNSLRFEVADDLAGLFGRCMEENTIIAIDIPIGLTDSEPRACDMEARELLGSSRSSSVFPAPCRPTLRATSYEDACRINLGCSGKKLSRQSYAILKRIRTIDGLVSPKHQERIKETHPEVTFARLNPGGRGLSSSKKKLDGRVERMRLLEKVFPQLELTGIRRFLGPRKVNLDDLIDGLACLATALRIHRGEARVLPEGRQIRDSRGLRMEIAS